MASHGKAEGAFPERPPYVVEWRVWTGFAFTTVAMHVDPDNVVQELDALGTVAASLVASRGDVIVLGDFNADCSYLGKTTWASHPPDNARPAHCCTLLRCTPNWFFFFSIFFFSML